MLHHVEDLQAIIALVAVIVLDLRHHAHASRDVDDGAQVQGRAIRLRALANLDADDHVHGPVVCLLTNRHEWANLHSLSQAVGGDRALLRVRYVCCVVGGLGGILGPFICVFCQRSHIGVARVSNGRGRRQRVGVDGGLRRRRRLLRLTHDEHSCERADRRATNGAARVLASHLQQLGEARLAAALVATRHYEVVGGRAHADGA
mmetsp:Transcript_85131/g.170063  ORF Transcript_85131/g.170063 Transcript_85131/m.170063 type:complete len:204 (-) Transcript_85131:687-1298(-)